MRFLVLSNNFVYEISEVAHWRINSGDSNPTVEEFNFKDNLIAKIYDECNITLETICSDNVNQLFFSFRFAH